LNVPPFERTIGRLIQKFHRREELPFSAAVSFPLIVRLPDRSKPGDGIAGTIPFTCVVPPSPTAGFDHLSHAPHDGDGTRYGMSRGVASLSYRRYAATTEISTACVQEFNREMARKTSACPACGGTVEFRSTMSLVTVCPYCHSAIARQDRQLTDLGKVAEITDSESPLQLGLRGTWRGKAFRLIGRVQYRHFAGGVWDEWYVAMPGGKWGWLSEAQGRFGILQARMVKDATLIPAYETLNAGEKLSLGAAGEFVVAEAGTAIVAGAEGDLPFSPTLQATHRFVDFEGPSGQLGTIEYSGESPQLFVGESATLLELGLAAAALKEVSTETVGAAHLNCPKCGGPLELVAPDEAQRVTCPNCRSLLDVTGNKLEFLSTVKPPSPDLKIPLGSRGKLRDIEYRVIGYVRRSVTFDKKYYWQEYLLYAPRHGYRWLIESDDHWSLGKPVPIGSIKRSYPTATYEGRTFRLFQKAAARVQQVWGEFYWKVQAGEEVGMNDYISPPFSLSLEVSSSNPQETTSEINSALSEYLPHAEVEQAFGVSNLPRGWGVAPNQPNPVTNLVYLQWVVFLLGIGAIYALLPMLTGRVVDFGLTLWAAGLVSTIPLGSLAYAHSFEQRRWHDSEFNPYDTGGGDDDE